MKYFTIEELTDSSVARQLHIDNTPTAEIKENLRFGNTKPEVLDL